MRLLTSAVALALLATPAVAQPRYFGAPAPLTNTRYEAYGTEPVLSTNGREAFLLWSHANAPARITRLVAGENRVGLPFLEGAVTSAVWTGTHFISAGSRGSMDSRSIIGRLLDENGEPLGPEFTIRESGEAPHLAWNGSVALMLHTGFATFLGADGRPLADRAGQTVMTDAEQSRIRGAVTSNGTGFAAITSGDQEVIIAVFDRNGSMIATRSFDIVANDRRNVAIASNGDGYAAVWSNGSRLETARLTADGRLVTHADFAATLLDKVGRPAIAWVGGNYHVAFSSGATLRHLTIDGASAPDDGLLPAAIYGQAAITVAGGRATVAWQKVQNGVLYARNLLDPADGGVEIAWAATYQARVVSATSNDAALIAWSEYAGARSGVWAGIRDRNGTWTERRIVTDGDVLSAASDGHGFVVITTHTDDYTWRATFLDVTGRVVGRTPVIAPYWPTGVVWTGSHYAVVRLDAQEDLYAQLLDRTGLVGAPVLLHAPGPNASVESAGIATNGTNLVAAWHTSESVLCFPPCDGRVTEVRAARLGLDLRRLGADVLVAEDPAEHTAVAWDGQQYMIVWNARARQAMRLEGRRMSSDGVLRATFSVPRAVVNRRTDVPPQLTRLRDGVGVNWPGDGSGEVFVLNENAFPAAYRFDASDAETLVRLPNGRTGYVQTATLTAAPHHGGRRLVLTVGDSVPLPDRADANALRARREDGSFILEWTAPRQVVNGYRIEYRVGQTGAWNELDTFYDSTMRSATIVPWRNASFEFRMRAWNDGGVGAYSNVVTMPPAKQRSVRR